VVDIAGFKIPSSSPVFRSLLAVHVPLGLLAAVTDAVAMFAEKQRSGHKEPARSTSGVSWHLSRP